MRAGWAPRSLVVLLALAAGACSRSGSEPSVQVLSPALPKRLDPYADSRYVSQNVFLNIYEPLVDRDPRGLLSPLLAESWNNPEPSLYVFHLRPGVVFHDGAPLDAGAVVESFARARRDGHFVGGALAEVEAVEAQDALTLVLRTRGPVHDLVFSLTDVPVTRSGPRPEAQLGTGPFRVQGFVPGQSIELVRFERYYGPRPYLARALFLPFGEPENAKQLLAAEAATLVIDPPRELVESVDPVRFEVWRRSGSSVTYLAFRLAPEPNPRSPFRDRRVREAVHLALDRERLIAAGSPLGTGAPANQLAAPGVFGFDPELPPAARDLPRARALLAEAGFPAGFEGELDTTPAYKPVAEAVAAQLLEAGLRVRVRYLASDEFVPHIEQRSDFYLYSWVLSLESGEALRSFLHTRDAARGYGLRNRTGYSNLAVDALLHEAMGSASPGERLPRLRQAMRLLMRDLPWVPLFAPHTARIYPRSLRVPTHTEAFLRLSDCAPAAP